MAEKAMQWLLCRFYGDKKGKSLTQALLKNPTVKAFIDRADEFPACAHLAEEGWVEASAFGALAEELGEALKDQGEPIVNITRALREALDDMPAGCKGLIVTDGTADDAG